MKIAIVKLSAMGDIIHAMVAIQFLKKTYPHFQIDWIVEESFAQILLKNPQLETILPINLKSIKKSIFNIFGQIKLLLEYRKKKYDVVIDAQGLIKSSLVSLFLSKERIGFDFNSTRESIASIFYTKKISIGYNENVIMRNIALICNPFGISVSRSEIENKQPFLFFDRVNNFEFINESKKNILLVLGASKQNKIYPKEKFSNLCKLIDANFVCIWANDFEYDCAMFLQNNNDNVSISPKLTLDELKSLVSKVDLVIGGDTGPFHMAWGLNKPAVGIFGNTPNWRNMFEDSRNKSIKSSSFVDPLKLDKNDFSINEIEENKIAEIAKGLIFD